MSRGEAILLHLSNAAVVATGLLLAVMAYLMEPAEEWSVVNHPWQPHVQHLHVLVAPWLVFAVGVIWVSHLVSRLGKGGRGRTTGLALVVGFVPMVVSGYAIQVAVGEGGRTVSVSVHLIASAIWVGAFVLHLVRRLIERREIAADAAPGVDVDLAA
ncbi:MAG TPA: hypothetical protein VLT32_16990 [Candidatus Sulfomarinibacteraceae bacterium]|nr:hypothetical protein [Candidatus Sulfomarinibacteraceae bacterium]